MPVGEAAIGGAGVVGAEDLRHEEKEFPQPSLFQSPGNGVSTFTFAERVALHMRVRHIIATAGTTRIESNHLIGLITAELIQRESNLERAEVDLFQDNPFGPDTENFGEPVDLDFIELVLDGLQFLEQEP